MSTINCLAMEIGNFLHLFGKIKVACTSYYSKFSVFYRFGSGIIIYWLGYLDQVATCPENKDFIIVTDDFPKKEELITLNLPFK